MSRFSPTVRPEAPRPLDFSPISSALREVQDRRRRERLERQEQDRYNQQQQRQQDLDTLERQRYGQRQEIEAQERAGELLSKGWQRTEEYRDPSVSRIRGQAGSVDAGGFSVPIPDVEQGLERRPGMESVRTQVDGSEYIFDPLRALQRRSAELTAERAAAKQGEYEGKYAAALEGGVPKEQAQRYAFGPAGLTAQERGVLNDQTGAQRMSIKAYEWGQRMTLQKRREAAALKLVSARQSGNPRASKAALQEYQMARDALAEADAQNRYNESIIPDDPMRYQDAMSVPEFAARVKAAEAEVKSYVEGGRRKELQEDVNRARSTVRGETRPSTAGSGGAPATTAKRMVSAAEHGRILESLLNTMSAAAAQAYMAKHFTIGQ